MALLQPLTTKLVVLSQPASKLLAGSKAPSRTLTEQSETKVEHSRAEQSGEE